MRPSALHGARSGVLGPPPRAGRSAATRASPRARALVLRVCASDGEVYDTVVVGAGICGLVTAQALAAKHGSRVPRFLVTEARERVGGNITSLQGAAPAASAAAALTQRAVGPWHGTAGQRLRSPGVGLAGLRRLPGGSPHCQHTYLLLLAPLRRRLHMGGGAQQLPA